MIYGFVEVGQKMIVNGVAFGRFGKCAQLRDIFVRMASLRLAIIRGFYGNKTIPCDNSSRASGSGGGESKTTTRVVRLPTSRDCYVATWASQRHWNCLQNKNNLIPFLPHRLLPWIHCGNVAGRWIIVFLCHKWTLWTTCEASFVWYLILWEYSWMVIDLCFIHKYFLPTCWSITVDNLSIVCKNNYWSWHEV